MREAVCLIIGDELLAGEIQDSNGPYFAEQLTAHGFQVKRINLLPDDVPVIISAVRVAMEEADLVVVCGGLGPTSDDRTSEAVAKVLGRALILYREQWESIRQLFLTFRGHEPPPGNEKQAMIPEGAEVLPNAMGTAPGYLTREREGDCIVAVLPGPPKENRPMYEHELLPRLDNAWPERERMVTRTFHVFGLPESEVGHRLRSIESEYAGVRVGYQFRFPEILAKLRCPSGAPDLLEGASAAQLDRLHPHVYGTGDETLPAVLGKRLSSLGLRIVTAESCTGGLTAKLLTDTPGSSAWMDAGFVTYSNAAKQKILGVPSQLLEEHGAVSEEVARAMLKGAFRRSSAEVGLAITGVAGPDGGSEDKPVGTVCIAWGRRRRVHTHTYRFAWDRDYNRLVSAWAAMHRLYLYLEEEN